MAQGGRSRAHRTSAARKEAHLAENGVVRTTSDLLAVKLSQATNASVDPGEENATVKHSGAVAEVSPPEAQDGTVKRSAADADMARGDALASPPEDLDGSWREGLEQLRKRRRTTPKDPTTAATGPLRDQIRAVEQLLQDVQTAVERQEWAAVVSPNPWPDLKHMAKVVKQLSEPEACELLRACALQYEAEPQWRTPCSSWIILVLQHRSCTLAGRPQLRLALQPLLERLTRQLPPTHREGEVISCVARWRAVAELAKARRESSQASTSASAPETAMPEPHLRRDSDA